MELAQLQDVSSESCGERDRARACPARRVGAEEVGELAQAVRKGSQAERERRVRDVLAWLSPRPTGRRRPHGRGGAVRRGCPRCGAALHLPQTSAPLPWTAAPVSLTLPPPAGSPSRGPLRATAWPTMGHRPRRYPCAGARARPRGRGGRHGATAGAPPPTEGDVRPQVDAWFERLPADERNAMLARRERIRGSRCRRRPSASPTASRPSSLAARRRPEHVEVRAEPDHHATRCSRQYPVAWARWRSSGSTLRFQPDRPLPDDVLRAVIEARRRPGSRRESQATDQKPARRQGSSSAAAPARRARRRCRRRPPRRRPGKAWGCRGDVHEVDETDGVQGGGEPHRRGAGLRAGARHPVEHPRAPSRRRPPRITEGRGARGSVRHGPRNCTS